MGVDIFRIYAIIFVMSVQKYNLYMGKYDELLEHFSFVFEKYEGKNTPYFDMPSDGIKKQFESILEQRVNMGVINYCKAIKHRKDPLVEVKTEFVYIEDMLEVADSKNSTSCGNTTWCGNTANITPEELFGDDFKNL
jgi:hypothetical protein